MKIGLTDDYILQLATAYAIHAIFVCSEYESGYYKEYSKEYWKSVVRELIKKEREKH